MTFTGQQPDIAPHAIDGHVHEAEKTMIESENAEPSSGLGGPLLRCNRKCNEIRRAGINTNAEPAQPNIAIRGNVKALHEMYPTTRQKPTVQFDGVEEVRRPFRPRYPVLGVYGQQRQRPALDQRSAHRQLDDELQDPYTGEDERFDAEEDYEDQDWGLGLAGIAYGVDVPGAVGDVEEGYEEEEMGRSTDRIRRGFWRPHKLY